MPGILSGAIIVFALAASAFATPAIIGGRRLKVASTLAYDEFLNTLNWPLGAAVAVLLLVALVADRRRLQPPGRAPLRARCSDEPQRSAGARLPHAVRRPSCWRRSWSSASSPSRPRAISRSRPTAGRCAGSSAIARYPEFISRLLDAASGWARCPRPSRVAFSVPAALAIARYRFRGREAMTALFMSPLMIPHVVLGIAFLRFFTQIGLGGTFIGPGAGAHRRSCCPSRCASRWPRRSGMDRAIEHAAVSLGASDWTVLPAHHPAADRCRAWSAAGRSPSSSPSTR